MRLQEKAYSKTAPFIIALDGPAASGKGLIGRKLSVEFNLKYVDSGAIYRNIAYTAMQQNVAIEDVAQIIKISDSNNEIIANINNNDLYSDQVATYTSKIAKIKEVRTNVGKYLDQLIKSNARIIIDGRDIGTVVAPFADLKIFITASLKRRAKRRFKQLRNLGKECMIRDIFSDMKKRDELDSKRQVAPLKVSPDALMIDTSELTPDQILEKIINFVGKS